MLIRRVEPTAPLHAVAKQYDILLSFDGVDIANDGTVPFRSGERISFSYLVSQVKSGLWMESVCTAALGHKLAPAGRLCFRASCYVPAAAVWAFTP